jgi:hypothetical protein
VDTYLCVLLRGDEVSAVIVECGEEAAATARAGELLESNPDCQIAELWRGATLIARISREQLKFPASINTNDN